MEVVIKLASSSSSDAVGDQHAFEPGWEALRLPEDILPLAIKTFGTPAEARSWIKLLDQKASRYWRTTDYLGTLAETGLDRQTYKQWGNATNWISYLPKLVKQMLAGGYSPSDVRPWIKAGFGTGSLRTVVHHDFKDAMRLLAEWYDPDSTKPKYGSSGELVELLKRGYAIDELWKLLKQGLRGHDVFEWVSSDTRIPREEWLSWQQQGVEPLAAEGFRDRGISPETAHAWALTGLPSTCIMQSVDLGDTPGEALERFDPLTQLPNVIKPGYIGLTLWPGNTAYEVTFRWDGGREAKWSHDISDANAGLSPMSSAPVFGTATWLNGRDLVTTYSSGDFGIDGEDVIEGAAPTAGAEDADRVMRDPQRWVDFAQMIHGYVRNLLN